jgi:hypothetical protein
VQCGQFENHKFPGFVKSFLPRPLFLREVSFQMAPDKVQDQGLRDFEEYSVLIRT